MLVTKLLLLFKLTSSASGLSHNLAPRAGTGEAGGASREAGPGEGGSCQSCLTTSGRVADAEHALQFSETSEYMRATVMLLSTVIQSYCCGHIGCGRPCGNFWS